MTIFTGTDNILFVFLGLALLKYVYLKDKSYFGFKIMIASTLLFILSIFVPANTLNEWGFSNGFLISKIIYSIGYIILATGSFTLLIEIFRE